MAKRFTDSEKWQDRWFRKLPSIYKLFWIFILDNCNHAGIWKKDLELAEFLIGEKFCEIPDEFPGDFKQYFGERIIFFSNDYWFIPKFVRFQYGNLNPESKIHGSVIKELEKHSLWEGYQKGIYKGLNTLKAKAKAKDKDKDKDKDKKKAKARQGVFRVDDFPDKGLISPEVAFYGAYFVVTMDLYQEWRKAYPGRDLRQEFRNANEWLKAKPDRQKKNYQSFLVNWLNRGENNVGTKNGGRGGQGGGGNSGPNIGKPGQYSRVGTKVKVK